jgi:hypothetical protein
VPRHCAATEGGDQVTEAHGNHRKAVARFRTDLDGPERDNEAARLCHAERLTWQEVADRLGFSHRRDAQRAAERSLQAARAVPTREMIAEVLLGIASDDAVATGIVYGPKRYKTSVTGKLIEGPTASRSRTAPRSSRRSWCGTSCGNSGSTCSAWPLPSGPCTPPSTSTANMTR